MAPLDLQSLDNETLLNEYEQHVRYGHYDPFGEFNSVYKTRDLQEEVLRRMAGMSTAEEDSE